MQNTVTGSCRSRCCLGSPWCAQRSCTGRIPRTHFDFTASKVQECRTKAWSIHSRFSAWQQIGSTNSLLLQHLPPMGAAESGKPDAAVCHPTGYHVIPYADSSYRLFLVACVFTRPFCSGNCGTGGCRR